MEAFSNEAPDLLAEGWNVELGNVGFFSTSLQCPPVHDKKEVGDKMRLQRGESLTHPKKNCISRDVCLFRLNKYLENLSFYIKTINKSIN